MTWTKTQPTAEGYYWLRMNGGAAEVVRVEQISTGGPLSVSFTNGMRDDVPSIGRHQHNVEWAGPIPEPSA